MDSFEKLGYEGPVPLLTGRDCRELLAIRRNPATDLIADWPKSLAVYEPRIFSIAAHPVLVSRVKSILGNDVLLWGASFVRSSPGHMHPWHNDIESSVEQGRTLSAWIGLEHTSQQSSLQIITRSHRFRESVQEVRSKHSVERGKATAEMVLTWAQERDPASAYIVPGMSNGEVILFDGWLWHATLNTGKTTRTALLLQYATPDTVIRIPDQNNYEWPFRTLSHPRPQCIMVSGSDKHGVNRIVPAPVTHDGSETRSISTCIRQLDIPLHIEKDQSWKPYPLFRGATPNVQSLTCHASTLRPGETPHPPHHHREEEILIILDGTAELTLPDLPAAGKSASVPVQAGDFVYYPAWFYHTITATGDIPVNYLMLKWYNGKGGKSVARAERLGYVKSAFSNLIPNTIPDRPFRTQVVYQGATECLARLQCHVSVLDPGGGYPSHTDAHDVAILVMDGEVKSLGVRGGPNSIYFFSAGEPHDMHNSGQEQAKYLVFEFHGTHPPAGRRRKRSLLQKAFDPQAWKYKFREWTSRFRPKV